MIRIAIADDHAIVRKGLRQIISEADGLSVTGEAATGDELLSLLRSQSFDAVVLDGPIPTGKPIAGATATTTPAGSSVHYNSANGFPSGTATSTAADGVAYVFNLTANVATTVSAAKAGATFKTHALETWPDALTTTVVTP